MPVPIDRLNNRQLLVEVLRNHASTTPGAEASVDKFVADIRGEKWHDQERLLASAIYDGLAYGNWPWVVADMNKVKG